MSKPIKVLFVCLGNICRSPMAEAIFQSMVQELPIEVDSAGTSAYHQGQDYHRETLRVCREHKVPLIGKSRPVSYADLQEFDYIVAMDEQNHADLLSLDQRGSQRHKIFHFREFARTPALRSNLNVPDPYYGGPKGFDELFELLRDCSEGLLERILEEHKMLIGH